MRIVQIINNLLGNAIKFTAEGGDIVFRIRTQKSGHGASATCSVQIDVEDNGIGIAPEVQEKIFRPFEKADMKYDRNFGGAGLGLSISRRLAQLMGGNVILRSQPGKGSIFTLSLNLSFPAAEAQSERQARDEESILTDGETAALKGKRVLIVDDVELNLEIVSAMLDPLELDIDVAANGEAAVRKTAANDYDFVFMDIQMPVMDGLAATRAIRKQEVTTGRGRVPIWAVSADALPNEIKLCGEAGMDGHIAKPVDPAGLYKALRDGLLSGVPPVDDLRTLVKKDH
jgi:CheY-like chemotaxis protein